MAGKLLFPSLGGVICIKLSENGSTTNLYRISDIPDFLSVSTVEN